MKNCGLVTMKIETYWNTPYFSFKSIFCLLIEPIYFFRIHFNEEDPLHRKRKRPHRKATTPIRKTKNRCCSDGIPMGTRYSLGFADINVAYPSRLQRIVDFVIKYIVYCCSQYCHSNVLRKHFYLIWVNKL